MRRVPIEVREHMTTYATGSDIGKIAKGTGINAEYLIKRIKNYNPSFSIIDLLSTELEYEREMSRLKKTPAYELWLLANPELGPKKHVYVEAPPDSIYFETKISENILNEIFGDDISYINTIDESMIVGHIKVGPTRTIKSSLQFLKDLNTITRYMNRHNPLYIDQVMADNMIL